MHYGMKTILPLIDGWKDDFALANIRRCTSYSIE